MKTIATVVGGRKYYKYVGNVVEVYWVIILDTPIPGIIYNPDTHEYTHGEVQRITESFPVGTEPFPIGTTLEIESTFHQAGENIDGNVISHDCYIRDIKVID